jgi:hypothetical protein
MGERNILKKIFMKKYSIIFFFIICLCYQSSAQQAVYNIAKTYYRSNPFENNFSKFLDYLMNDPTLVNKTIHKKTDSTLFFLEGTYATHNPVFFKASQTNIILAEREEVENDSSQYIHTFFVYQLISYASPGEEGIKDVREEYEKFCRHYKKKFEGDHYKELKAEEKQAGEITDYSLKYPRFFPLSVAWATSREHDANIFALTIRFMVFENQAYLPITPDDF